MDHGLDLEPVPFERRRASFLDTAVVFAGANVVATTLAAGGTLGLLAPGKVGLWALAAGLLVGTLPTAILARLGPRRGLPTMVLLREPFGALGAAAIAALLVVTNFAWIALNDVIAARALQGILGGDERLWALLAGTVAALLALGGPRLMALFGRFAVPLMAIVGVALTLALVRSAPAVAATTPAAGAVAFLAGLDLVVAYQVSWSLMFADYTRFQRSERSASLAVLVGLSATSAWLRVVGMFAARAGSNDPAEMIVGLGLPAAALVAIVLSTLTTNFVNIFLSALALRTLLPRVRPVAAVLLLGGVGAILGALRSDLLDRYAAFMGILATLLLPIVAIALVHWFVRPVPPRDDSPPRVGVPAATAWVAGAITYTVASRVLDGAGSTLPTLLLAGTLYAVLSRPRARAGRSSGVE
ncbi:MAG TPA: cytosine permease [Thermoanaerobaculia bacterium]|nr:cytosine permease [Thermoanaerobaculia bacterium]